MAAFVQLQHVAPPEMPTAATTAMVAAGLAATSAGAALSGWLIEHNGPATASACATTAVTLMTAHLIWRLKRGHSAET